VPGLDAGAGEFRDLARNLRLVGADELRRELYKGIDDAAGPLARGLKDPAHLKPYMPDRYAAVLAADLAVTTSKRTGIDPGVFIKARGRTKYRHVERIDQGLLRHPVYADTDRPRPEWHWVAQDILAGFFTNPTERAAPAVRREIVAAMHRIAERALGR